jgi:hypothetical protein
MNADTYRVIVYSANRVGKYGETLQDSVLMDLCGSYETILSSLIWLKIEYGEYKVPMLLVAEMENWRVVLDTSEEFKKLMDAVEQGAL